jgi:hypothetical protein
MEYIYIEGIKVIGTFYVVAICGKPKLAVVLIQIGHEILLNLTKIILLFGLFIDIYRVVKRLEKC